MKKLRVITVCILAVIILISSVSCGGRSKQKELTLMTLFTDNTFTFPLNNYLAGSIPPENGRPFYCSKDIFQLAEYISGLDGVVDLVRRTTCISFFVFHDEDGTTVKDEYVIIDMAAEDRGKGYKIAWNKAVLKYGGYTSDNDFYNAYGGVVILLPIYFVSDLRLTKRGDWPTLLENVEYETQSTIDDFYNYYLNCGWYEVDKQANRLIISGYTQTPQKSDADDFDVPFPMEIVFSKYLGQSFFTFRLSEK